MNISFERDISDVRHINEERNYWFIRTYSGQTYNNFIHENYVGIGFNKIPFKYIENCKPGGSGDAYNTLWDFIKNDGYNSSETTKWLNQLVNFQHEIKKDDLIIIPSKNSEHIAIGRVISDVVLTKVSHTFKFSDHYEPYPEKRRKIQWITSKDRDSIQGELRNMFYSHRAITQVNQYAEMIEGLVSSMFIKKDRIYLIIEINQHEEINAFHLNRFLSSLTFFYEEFCKEANIPYNENLTIKIKVQSRGKMALAAFAMAGILGLGGLIELANNPQFTIDLKNLKIEAKSSQGLLKTYSDFLDAEQRRKMEYEKFQDSLKHLQATRPVQTPVLYDDGSNEFKEQRETKDTTDKGNKN